MIYISGVKDRKSHKIEIVKSAITKDRDNGFEKLIWEIVIV